MSSQRPKVNVRVVHPPGLTEAFKDLARARTRAALARVWVYDLHDEAIRRLLDRLARGEEPQFYASPLKTNVQKTLWIDPALHAEVKAAAARHHVAVATFVLSACLDYLKEQGITLR